MKKQNRLLTILTIFILSSFLNLNASKLNLSVSEQNYLDKKKQITVCIDPDWMPYEKIQNNKHVGMSSDFINLIEKKINTPINLIPTKTWAQSISYAKNRACDMFSLVKETPSRKKYMDFTTPYFNFPLVIATTTDKLFVSNIETILNKKLGIVKGYAFIELLKNKYPKINIIEVDSVSDGLKKVKNKNIYGYIDSVITIGYELQRSYSTVLKVSGQFDLNFSLSIATRNDEPHLYSIMQKAVVSIDEKATQTIVNEWIDIKIEKSVNYTLLWESIFVLLVIIIAFINRHYFLLKAKRVLEKKVEDKTKELQTLNENLEQTVLRRTEELESSNEVFQLMLHSTMEAIFILEYNYCVDANNEAVNLFNYTNSEELVGTFIFDLLDKTSHEFLASTENQSQGMPYEVKAKKSDGSVFPALIRIQSLKTKNRTIKILTLLDLTKIKEQELKLINQSKMASLGELLGNIAHQWRQPLAVITTAASGMKMQKELDILSDDEFNKNCDDIVDSSSYLSKTINDFKHLIKGNKRKIDFKINETIKHSSSLLTGLLSSNLIKIKYSLDEERIFNGYSNDLTQVIVSIIKNSNDAFNKNKIDVGKYIFIETSQKDDNLIICIKDNAGGIPSDILDKIFEPYFTTKHKTQGTGLGLYMTHQLINDSFNGSIEVINEEFNFNNKTYEGAKFILTLPIKENTVLQ